MVWDGDLGEADRYVVRVSSKGIEVNLHRKDIEASLTTREALYCAEHPWALKAHIELSKGSVMKMDERSRAQLGFIRGFLFSNNSKVHDDPCWSFLTDPQMNRGMHGQRKIVGFRKEEVLSYGRSTQ